MARPACAWMVRSRFPGQLGRRTFLQQRRRTWVTWQRPSSPWRRVWSWWPSAMCSTSCTTPPGGRRWYTPQSPRAEREGWRPGLAASAAARSAEQGKPRPGSGTSWAARAARGRGRWTGAGSSGTGPGPYPAAGTMAAGKLLSPLALVFAPGETKKEKGHGEGRRVRDPGHSDVRHLDCPDRSGRHLAGLDSALGWRRLAGPQARALQAGYRLHLISFALCCRRSGRVSCRTPGTAPGQPVVVTVIPRPAPSERARNTSGAPLPMHTV